MWYTSIVVRNVKLELKEQFNRDSYSLVAVSGGPDSMALLDILYKMNFFIQFLLCFV